MFTLLREDSRPTSPISAIASTPAPTTLTPSPICTELRFGERLSPDDIDILLNEGEHFANIWDFVARFDCPQVVSDQITFKWFYNSKPHCTHTYKSDNCDMSSLTDWKNASGKYLITIRSKDFPDDLAPGTYKLVVFVDNNEVSSGTVLVTQ